MHRKNKNNKTKATSLTHPCKSEVAISLELPSTTKWEG
jgi:hypothetical protein